MAIKIPATSGAASEADVTSCPLEEGVASGCVERLAVGTGETAATDAGVCRDVGLTVTAAVGFDEGAGGEVGAGVGRSVGRGVGLGVGVGVGEAATTVIVPFIPESAWIWQ